MPELATPHITTLDWFAFDVAATARWVEMQREQEREREATPPVAPAGKDASVRDSARDARPHVGRLQSPTQSPPTVPSVPSKPASQTPYDPVPMMNEATGELRILGGEIPPWDPRHPDYRKAKNR